MKALCVDFNNPLNNPTPVQLKALGADAVRPVLFNNPTFYHKYRAMKARGYKVAVVLALESILYGGYGPTAERYCQALADVPPDLILIGNEPDANIGSVSSWVMTQEEYLDLWNTVVPIFKARWPEVPCFIGGLLSNPRDGWLDLIWPGSPGGVPDAVSVLDPLPDGLDVHYPDSVEVLEDWEVAYGLPISMMESCYKGKDVSRTAVVEWYGSVYRLTGMIGDFTWSDTVVPGMGLVNAHGIHLKAWADLRAAFQAIGLGDRYT